MGMWELAHNSCYIDESRCTRYRDFETDIDARDFARELYKFYAKEELPEDIDEFDEYVMDDLQYGAKDIAGFLALFYRNLWAMAELREWLKAYEDAEEQGLLAKVVHGEWLDMTESHKDVPQYRCSACGVSLFNVVAYKYNHCPNCGAKMDGKEEGAK